LRANAIEAATSLAFSAITIPCGWIESNSGSYTRRAFGYADEPGLIREPLSCFSSEDHVGCGEADADGVEVVVDDVEGAAEDNDAARVQASRIEAATPVSATPIERLRKVRRRTRGCYPATSAQEMTARR
jgi:hypothetical protein